MKLWRHLSCRLRVLNSSFALRVYPPRLESRSALCVFCEFEFWTGRRVCYHRHIAFLAVIEDAPLLTKTVKINQSEGISGSGIPERAFVKNSYKRSRTSLPSFPLLFIAFFTSHRSPLSERLEQATHSVSIQLYRPQKSIQVSPACSMLLALRKFDQTMWFSWSYFRSDPKFYPHFQTRPCTPLQNQWREQLPTKMLLGWIILQVYFLRGSSKAHSLYKVYITLHFTVPDKKVQLYSLW